MRHVRLMCLNHPNLRWQCKSIAVNNIGQYNGARNIFFLGSHKRADEALDAIGDWAKNGKPGDALDISKVMADEPECQCPSSDLRFAPEELEQQKTEPLTD